MSGKTRWEGRGQQPRDSRWDKQDTAPGSAPRQRRNSALDFLLRYRVWDHWELKRTLRFILMAAPMMTWGQTPLPEKAVYSGGHSKNQVISRLTAVNTYPMCRSNSLPLMRSSSSPSSDRSDGDDANRDLDTCKIHAVRNLPGTHQFGSDFIEAMAVDPDPKANDSNVVWGLTADLSSKVPSQDRVMYISKSTNGGKAWTRVVRVDSRYFDADIGEGERNGLGVSPGETDFVITTQRGAFQIIPQSSTSDVVVKSIAGPRVPQPDPKVSIPKREGDPVKAGVVQIAADGKVMMISYGYFDLNPQIIRYHKDDNGSWIEDGPLPHLPTQMDILSMQFDHPKNPRSSSLYVGTGDQAYHLNSRTMKWTRIAGVGADSAVQGISTVGGPHLAACWGVYNPSGADAVMRVTSAKFLLHRGSDQAGPNIRAYSIEVDPSKPNREVVTSATGVYTSKDRGKSWRRLNDLPNTEFRSAHFNSDGTIIISGIAGTFLANPFSKACSPQLKTRVK